MDLADVYEFLLMGMIRQRVPRLFATCNKILCYWPSIKDVRTRGEGFCQKLTPADGGKRLKENGDVRKILKKYKFEIEESVLKKSLLIDYNLQITVKITV